MEKLDDKKRILGILGALLLIEVWRISSFSAGELKIIGNLFFMEVYLFLFFGFYIWTVYWLVKLIYLVYKNRVDIDVVKRAKNNYITFLCIPPFYFLYSYLSFYNITHVIVLILTNIWVIWIPVISAVAFLYAIRLLEKPYKVIEFSKEHLYQSLLTHGAITQEEYELLIRQQKENE